MTNKEIIVQWFKHIDSKNFDAVKQLMAANHQFANAMTPAPVGTGQHIGMMQMMTSSLQGVHELGLVLESGEYVTVTGKFNGKHTGEFNGVPATSNPVVFSFIDVFHIENGKVTDEHLEMNPMAIMMQIGAMPANA